MHEATGISREQRFCAAYLCCQETVTDRPCSHFARANSSHLLLREQDVLPHPGIILDELQLIGQGARIFLGYIEIARAGSAHKLDQDTDALLAPSHDQ